MHQSLVDFLAYCAGFTTVALAVSWLIRAIRVLRAPSKRTDERLEALEKEVKDLRQYLANDKERLDAIEAGNRLTQKAILALLAHGIDGNDIDALRTAKKELQEFLIER